MRACRSPIQPPPWRKTPQRPQPASRAQVNRLARLFEAALRQRIAAHGVVPCQFPALLALFENDGRTQRELCDTASVDQPTMAKTLARMRRDGLVREEPEVFVLDAGSVRIRIRHGRPELVILALRWSRRWRCLARNAGAVWPPGRQDNRVLPQRMPAIDHAPVVLREFGDGDIGVVRSAAADPLIPLITTVPAGGGPADALAYIERQRQRLPSGAGCSFAIASARTGEAVGQIGLWLRDLNAGRASTGYWIAPEHRRRGYATAALDAITRWGLTLPGIHRIELHVEPRNRGSWRAAERAGYQREGLLRSWQQVGTERRDMYVYSAIRHDQDPAPAGGAGYPTPLILSASMMISSRL
ncbi:MAG: GNAT family N-acetyltransferase [Streptosporangiaceae bacterium]